MRWGETTAEDVDDALPVVYKVEVVRCAVLRVTEKSGHQGKIMVQIKSYSILATISTRFPTVSNKHPTEFTPKPFSSSTSRASIDIHQYKYMFMNGHPFTAPSRVAWMACILAPLWVDLVGLYATKTVTVLIRPGNPGVTFSGRSLINDSSNYLFHDLPNSTLTVIPPLLSPHVPLQ